MPCKAYCDTEPLRRARRTDRQRDRLFHNKCHTLLGCVAKKMWTADGRGALWWLVAIRPCPARERSTCDTSESAQRARFLIPTVHSQSVGLQCTGYSTHGNWTSPTGHFAYWTVRLLFGHFAYWSFRLYKTFRLLDSLPTNHFDY